MVESRIILLAVLIQLFLGVSTENALSQDDVLKRFTIREQIGPELFSPLSDELELSGRFPEKPGYKDLNKGASLSLSDFKFPQITISDHPTKGNIMTALIKGASNYLYIFNNDAVPLYVRLMPHPVTNLKPHPSGVISYYDSFVKGFILLDSTLAVIDTITMKNGYRTDSHEILYLKNRHAFLFSYDPRIVDMSKVVVGGDPAATVTGLVIQELDENKNLIFQWRSWDYFNIIDSYSDLLSSVVDYVHGNSLDEDTDTTLIISSRNLNEVTKINTLTGKIIWRLGGKNNEFVFENDPRRFTGQHTAIKQKNGTLTLYDNGIGSDPLYSRGIEYEIDEINKKVKLIHEYRQKPDVYANISGNLQRLDNGNTLIFWGPALDHSEQIISEFDKTGVKKFEAKFDSNIYPTYRAYRSEWAPKLFTLSTDSINVESIVQDATLYRSIKIRNNSLHKINITSAYHKNLGFYVNDLPVTIEAGSEASFTIAFPSFAPGIISDNVYFCQETDSMIVSRSVFVSINNVPSTGVEDQLLTGFKVGPNPGNGEFNIEIKRQGRFLLRLIDMSGKKIWNEEGAGIDLYHIDLRSQPDGLYLLLLEEENTGIIHTIKLIKQK